MLLKQKKQSAILKTKFFEFFEFLYVSNVLYATRDLVYKLHSAVRDSLDRSIMGEWLPFNRAVKDISCNSVLKAII